MQHGLVDEAIRRAEECGTPVPASAFCREARFEGVGEVLAQSVWETDATGFLLGGDREGALRAMHAEAAQQREVGRAVRAAGGGSEYREGAAQRSELLADGLAASERDAAALARLREAERDGGLVSLLLLADLASGAERIERAEALWRQPDRQAALLGLVLLAEAQPDRAATALAQEGAMAYRNNRQRSPSLPRPALRQAIASVEGSSGSESQRPLLALLRLLRVEELASQARVEEAEALLTNAASDLDAARASIAQGSRVSLPVVLVIESEMLLQRAALALDAGEAERAAEIAALAPDRVQDTVLLWIQERRGSASYPSPSEPWLQSQGPVGGAELARMFPPSDPVGQVADPWSIPPFLPGGREFFVSHLRWSSDHLNEGCWPKTRFERAVREARLARVLEQPEWAEESLARVRRFDDAFSQRDTAMAAYLFASPLRFMD